MSRTRYGVAPWTVATPPKSRVFPTRITVERAEVVVVGAGLTGILTATALKASGADVVLVEAARVGAGESSAASGVSGLLAGCDYRALESTHGRRIARTLMTTIAAARGALASGLAKAKIAGAGNARPLLLVADPGVKGWDREVAARVEAGLTAAAVTGARFSRATTADATAGLQVEGTALLDPARILGGAITRLAGARVKTFEKSPVSRIAFSRTDATVYAGGAAILTPRVVVCTDAPGTLAPTLDRHVRGLLHYHVLTAPMPAAMRKAVGLAAIVLGDRAARVAITATTDGRLLLTGGEGPLVPDKARAAAVVQRTGQLMYECLKRFPAIVGLRPEFGWATSVVAGPDRFPLVGPHRQYPHQLFSFGTDGDPALAWMASRMLVRAVERTIGPADDAFGFGRVQEDRS